MGERKPLNSIYEERMRLAGRELSAFIVAVTELYGPEQAELSENDWLEELDLVKSVSLFTNGHCRAVTIAASVRLAERLNILLHPAEELVVSS